VEDALFYDARFYVFGHKIGCFEAKAGMFWPKNAGWNG
jgi:hypothetical protein